MTSHSLIFAFVFHFPLTSKHNKKKIKKWTPITLRRAETVANMASVEIQTAFFRWCRRGKKKDIKREKDQRTRTQWSIITKKKKKCKKKKIEKKNPKKKQDIKRKNRLFFIHFGIIIFRYTDNFCFLKIKPIDCTYLKSSRELWEIITRKISTGYTKLARKNGSWCIFCF